MEFRAWSLRASIPSSLWLDAEGSVDRQITGRDALGQEDLAPCTYQRSKGRPLPKGFV